MTSSYKPPVAYTGNDGINITDIKKESQNTQEIFYNTVKKFDKQAEEQIEAFQNIVDNLENFSQKLGDIQFSTDVMVQSPNNDGNSYLDVIALHEVQVPAYDVDIQQLAQKDYATWNIQSNLNDVCLDYDNMKYDESLRIGQTNIPLDDAQNNLTYQDIINRIKNVPNADFDVNVITIAQDNYQVYFYAKETGKNLQISLDHINDVDKNNLNIVESGKTERDLSAIFKINNIEVVRSTNNVHDVVQGVTFNFKKTTPPGTNAYLHLQTSPKINETLDIFKTIKTETDLINKAYLNFHNKYFTIDGSDHRKCQTTLRHARSDIASCIFKDNQFYDCGIQITSSMENVDLIPLRFDSTQLMQNLTQNPHKIFEKVQKFAQNLQKKIHSLITPQYSFSHIAGKKTLSNGSTAQIAAALQQLRDQYESDQAFIKTTQEKYISQEKKNITKYTALNQKMQIYKMREKM